MDTSRLTKCIRHHFWSSSMGIILGSWSTDHHEIGNYFTSILSKFRYQNFDTVIKLSNFQTLSAFVNPLKLYWLSWFLEVPWRFYQACTGQESEEIHRLQPVNFITKIQYCHSHFANKKTLLCKYNYQFADMYMYLIACTRKQCKRLHKHHLPLFAYH